MFWQSEFELISVEAGLGAIQSLPASDGSDQKRLSQTQWDNNSSVSMECHAGDQCVLCEGI